MSRNNKNAIRHAKAREISEMHKNGQKGPARTTPKHGKNPGRRLWSTTCRGKGNFA